MSTVWNIGDAPIVEATLTPHTSNPTGEATTVTCTFTSPANVVGSPIAMTEVSTNLWRCTGPTITTAGVWRYKVDATAGLIGAENRRITVVP